MTQFIPRLSNRIACRAGQQEARVGVQVSASNLEKFATKPTLPCLIRKSTRIATFNVRTLQHDKQINELISSAKKQGIDIICIQEHRFYHEESAIKYHKPGKGWTFITTSAWKNSTNSTIGRVRILLSPKALKSLNSIEKIASRIVIASFSGNPQITVICCYSPTNVSDENEVVQFYDELASLTRDVPKHNILVVTGDMNAKVENSDAHRHSFHTTTNRNGEHFNQYLLANSLYCLNTNFQKRTGKKWTHRSPNGHLSQIDYIAINKKWVNSAKNCEAYNSFEGVFTDHRIVTANLKVSFRTNKKKSYTSTRYQWSQLTTDPHTRDRFATTLNNRFDTLNDLSNDDTPNSIYQNFIEASKHAAKRCLPERDRLRQKLPWENDTVIGVRNELRAASKSKNKNPTPQNIDAATVLQRKLEQVYKSEKAKFIQEKIDSITAAAESQKSSLAWQTINKITGRKNSSKAKLKGDSQDERVSKWKEHFKNLLGPTP